MFRANFETELAQLHQDIIDMGNYVNKAIKKSIQAYSERDIELCREVIENDHVVNDMEKKIESKCLWLIAKEQPLASDLRKITTALKIATDMERIGDHAADIAELTLKFADKNSFSDSSHILPMAAAAIEMTRSAVTAYVNSDIALAKSTEAKDDEVDRYFSLIKQELAEVFSREPQRMDNAVDFLLIAKYLERIADHAVNICEWVHFSQTGEYKDTRIF